LGGGGREGKSTRKGEIKKAGDTNTCVKKRLGGGEGKEGTSAFAEKKTRTCKKKETETERGEEKKKGM